MEKYGFKNVRVKDPSLFELKVVDNAITIAQINRGPSDIGSYRRALQSAESVRNPNRRLWYELVENIITDGVLGAVMGKRVRAVTINPPSLEGTDDEDFIKLFKAPWMFDLLKHMMGSRFWGHSLVEPDFNPLAFKDPELEQLFKMKLVPRKNVSPEFGIISKQGGNYSSVGLPFREEPYEPFLLEFGEPRDLGLFMNLVPYVLFKRNNWNDFAQFNELFGMPQRVYEYDPHQPETRKQVEQQAKAAGSAPYVIVPKGTTVQNLQANNTSSAGGYKDFNQIMNQEMTISVLGQTLTTGADGKGSYALGEVHQDVEQAINLEDKVWCEYQLNWNVKRKLINTFGMDKLRGCTFKFDDTIKLTPKEKMEILTRLDAVTPIDQQYLRDEFNLPEPSKESITLWESRRKSDQQPMVGLSMGKPMAQLLLDYGQPLDSPKIVQLSMEDDMRKEVERIITAIHAGTMKRGEVPQELVDLVYKALDQAIGSGYGALKLESDKLMMDALKDNIFEFAANKEYQFIKDAFQSLLDGEGKVKPFNIFRDEVLKIHQDYNVNWLQSEYQAARGNAQMASRWNDIQENKASSPFLKFRAVLDDRSRHKQYHGIIRPVDDPAWDYMMPLLGWGCRCTVNAVSRGTVSPDEALPQLEDIKPAFRFNPGKEKMVFSKTHPYFNVDAVDKKAQGDNWGLNKPD